MEVRDERAGGHRVSRHQPSSLRPRHYRRARVVDLPSERPERAVALVREDPPVIDRRDRQRRGQQRPQDLPAGGRVRFKGDVVALPASLVASLLRQGMVERTDAPLHRTPINTAPLAAALPSPHFTAWNADLGL
jgi:hypothetical protein